MSNNDSAPYNHSPAFSALLESVPPNERLALALQVEILAVAISPHGDYPGNQYSLLDPFDRARRREAAVALINESLRANLL